MPDYVSRPATSYEGLEARFITATSPVANYNLVLPELWNEFHRSAHKIRGIDPHGAVYGLCDSPEAHGLERTHQEEALYLASVPVDASRDPHPEMKRWHVPAGLYAKFEHRGSVERLGETIRFIHEEWLPNSEFNKHQGPDIERYDHRFDPFSSRSVIEIFISIR